MMSADKSFMWIQKFFIQNHRLVWSKKKKKKSDVWTILLHIIAVNLFHHTSAYLTGVVLFLDSSSVFSPSSFWGHSPGQGSVQLRAPTQRNSPESPDTFAHFLRLFSFFFFFSSTNGQLHSSFTGIILDGNVLIIPVNCQRSTLLSIISDSFEFLLAALVHKFHKR